MKIGIIGLGFVGNAMLQSFKKIGFNEDSGTLIGYDKFKNGGIGRFEDILNSDIVFLALPTLYNDETKKYDLTAIEETLQKLKDNNFSKCIVIKSTITPKTISMLEDKYDLGLVHNPEFLTARTAEYDFHYQSHIILGRGDKVTEANYNLVYGFYYANYKLAEITKCKAIESENMKIFTNTFYAIKVQFFTELYLACQKEGADYEHVKNMMIRNGWINPMHTNVPGPDGQVSYGGMCFPKDTKALAGFLKENNSPCKLIEACIEERDSMRDDE